MHKIAECVLESMNVTYGGERFKSFDGIGDGGAPPVETTITLNFKEMELITREKVREGYYKCFLMHFRLYFMIL